MSRPRQQAARVLIWERDRALRDRLTTMSLTEISEKYKVKEKDKHTRKVL
jgi:hypothetical protein